MDRSGWLFYDLLTQGWPGGGGGGVVEYKNTQNNPSNVPKNKQNLVLNTKAKKTMVYLIPKISHVQSKEYKD